ncbi:MAG TPA: transcriptional regulator [Oscillibacter sp.]|nr:transcriptional regulator [Oscillibacter sp.]
MLFSSVPFLFYFLPAALLLYFLVPRRLKNAALLLASLFFYAWGEPKYVVLMLVSIAQGYLFGLLVEKYRGRNASRLFLSLSILVSLGLLGYFKYADFFLASVNAVTGLSLPLLKLSLPIGISFYTFQVLSYVIDVYRGDTAAQRNFIDLAAYVSLFPQLIAGPIVRYSDVALQLRERSHSVSAAAEGVRRFTIGFCKKILLANQFGALASAYQQTQQESVLFVWLYALAFLLQVYFDFSGYSDMAIGLGRILGFRFSENFNYPYVSTSITEFWRRWHISLGSWFRDYLYIPLGGSRRGRARQLLNIFIVWLATGLWHGAAWTFVLWGLWFAILLLLEKLVLLPILEKHRIFGHVYTLFFVTLGFVLFDASTAAQAFSRIGAMLGAGDLPLVSAQAVYYLKSYAPLLVLGMLCATPLPKKAVALLREKKGAALALDVLEPLCVLLPLLIGTAFLVDGSFNPFLYFRF